MMSFAVALPLLRCSWWSSVSANVVEDFDLHTVRKIALTYPKLKAHTK